MKVKSTIQIGATWTLYKGQYEDAPQSVGSQSNIRNILGQDIRTIEFK